jgi:hypothetical protein
LVASIDKYQPKTIPITIWRKTESIPIFNIRIRIILQIGEWKIRIPILIFPYLLKYLKIFWDIFSIFGKIINDKITLPVYPIIHHLG